MTAPRDADLQTQAGYSAPAKALHWVAVLLMLFLFGVGVPMVRMDFSDFKVQVYSRHEWAGVTLWFLTWLRLAWRLVRPAPPLPADLPRRMRLAARASHAALYVLMLTLPVVGYLGSNAVGFPVTYFNLWRLPDPIGPNRDLGFFLLALHSWLAIALGTLIVIHVGAALFHRFVRRDAVFERMWPFAANRRG